MYLCIRKKTVNLNNTNMAHLYKRDQNCYWESEIPDDKIVAVMPNDCISVIVTYVDRNGETQAVICDKISFI